MRLYRFLLAPLLLSLALSPLLAQSRAATDPDLLELQRYTLTMDKVTRFYESMKDLADLSAAHPELKNKLETDADKHEDLGAIEHRIAAEPLIVSTIAKHGFTPREFVVCEMAYIQTAFASAMLKQPGVDRAKMIADAHINPANIAFVEQHQADLQALQQRYEPEQKKPAKQSSGSEDDN